MALATETNRMTCGVRSAMSKKTLACVNEYAESAPRNSTDTDIQFIAAIKL